MIKVGTRVHCILYGGKDGVVYKVHGEQRPETIRSVMGGAVTMGGNAHFDIVWERGTVSLKIPESILCGSVQWRVLDGLASEHEIQQMLEFVEQETDRKNAEEIARAAQFSADKARLIAENPKLEVVTSDGKYYVTTTKNLRTSLKLQFPGCKFSVRRDGNSVSICWTDGPTASEVDEVAQKFKSGHFDGMQDIYEYTETPWTSAFGSVKYIHTSREKSQAFKERMIDILFVAIPSNMTDFSRDFLMDVANGKSSGWVNIPHLDISLNDALAVLGACWNADNNSFVKSARGFVRNGWLVDFAIDRMHEQVAA